MRIGDLVRSAALPSPLLRMPGAVIVETPEVLVPIPDYSETPITEPLTVEPETLKVTNLFLIPPLPSSPQRVLRKPVLRCAAHGALG